MTSIPIVSDEKSISAEVARKIKLAINSLNALQDSECGATKLILSKQEPVNFVFDAPASRHKAQWKTERERQRG